MRLIKIFFWVNILDEIIRDYNNSIHRTIGMKPIEVNKGNEKDLLEIVFKYTPPDLIKKSNLKPGDRVRIASKKETFSSIRTIGQWRFL